jgi:hypothetical protein
MGDREESSEFSKIGAVITSLARPRIAADGCHNDLQARSSFKATG